jgi:hypothetical protein
MDISKDIVEYCTCGHESSYHNNADACRFEDCTCQWLEYDEDITREAIDDAREGKW